MLTPFQVVAFALTRSSNTLIYILLHHHRIVRWLEHRAWATTHRADCLKRAELFTVAQQGLIGWVKKNVDILMEVLNSVRGIVQANLSVLTSICWTLLSLFLGGGQAVITFIINSVSGIVISSFSSYIKHKLFHPIIHNTYLHPRR